MAKLVVIRHGTTALNESHRIRGWSNPPLAKEGKTEIHTLAAKLQKEGLKPDLLVSSDLDRAVNTAKMIGEALGVSQLQLDWHFRPWNVGDFTGEESEKAHPQLMKYVKDRFKKVPGGESFEEFDKRFMTALHQLLVSHPSDDIILVTHHRGDRVIAANMGGTFRPEHMDMEGMPPGHHVVYTHKGGSLSQ